MCIPCTALKYHISLGSCGSSIFSCTCSSLLSLTACTCTIVLCTTYMYMYMYIQCTCTCTSVHVYLYLYMYMYVHGVYYTCTCTCPTVLVIRLGIYVSVLCCIYIHVCRLVCLGYCSTVLLPNMCYTCTCIYAYMYIIVHNMHVVSIYMYVVPPTYTCIHTQPPFSPIPISRLNSPTSRPHRVEQLKKVQCMYSTCTMYMYMYMYVYQHICTLRIHL